MPINAGEINDTLIVSSTITKTDPQTDGTMAIEVADTIIYAIIPFLGWVFFLVGFFYLLYTSHFGRKCNKEADLEIKVPIEGAMQWIAIKHLSKDNLSRNQKLPQCRYVQDWVTLGHTYGVNFKFDVISNSWIATINIKKIK